MQNSWNEASSGKHGNFRDLIVSQTGGQMFDSWAEKQPTLVSITLNFSPQQLQQKKETGVFQGDDRHPLAPAKAPGPLALHVLCLRCLSTLITEPTPPRGSAAR